MGCTKSKPQAPPPTKAPSTPEENLAPVNSQSPLPTTTTTTTPPPQQPPPKPVKPTEIPKPKPEEVVAAVDDDVVKQEQKEEEEVEIDDNVVQVVVVVSSEKEPPQVVAAKVPPPQPPRKKSVETTTTTVAPQEEVGVVVVPQEEEEEVLVDPPVMTIPKMMISESDKEVVVEEPAVAVTTPPEVVVVVEEEEVEVKEEEQVPVVPLSMEERLNTENAVLYPSAKAALNSRGLQKYCAYMDTLHIESFHDVLALEEIPSDDPFWTQMPPFPDRKKFKQLIEDCKLAFAGTSTATPTTTTTSELVENGINPAVAPLVEEMVEKQDVVQDVSSSLDDIGVVVREKTELPCDNYEVDVYARDFGQCQCGHSKQSHFMKSSEPSFAKRQPSQQQLEVAEGADSSSCTVFKLDLSAPTPVCVTCKQSKQMHTTTTTSNVSNTTNNGEETSVSNRFKEMQKGSFMKKSASNLPA